MSESAPSDVGSGEFVYPNPEAGETFVRTLIEHRDFCYWCCAPLAPNPVVQFPDEPEGWPLETSKTFDEYGTPVDDVPPDRTDGRGQVVEPSREERTICGNCGVLDTGPQYPRSKETTRQALTHVLSILDENGVITNPMIANLVVDEAFAERKTGQFCQVIGKAIYRSISD
ncbi:hypothetical protein [Natrialba sp. INN-245]|uniref:hypothetical protein n=1 Tax=Natrialba sp. INN-245 TaxID=2690967 RepID=UPI001311E965|nr:hypothetical protein [Natrialba sp. INN-245]MWV40116.1 hypothetical protein [Natrialba sp. INN-245]